MATKVGRLKKLFAAVALLAPVFYFQGRSYQLGYLRELDSSGEQFPLEVYDTLVLAFDGWMWLAFYSWEWLWGRVLWLTAHVLPLLLVVAVLAFLAARFSMWTRLGKRLRGGAAKVTGSRLFNRLAQWIRKHGGDRLREGGRATSFEFRAILGLIVIGGIAPLLIGFGLIYVLLAGLLLGIPFDQVGKARAEELKRSVVEGERRRFAVWKAGDLPERVVPIADCSAQWCIVFVDRQPLTVPIEQVSRMGGRSIR